MLLLNFVRTLLTIGGLLLAYTFQKAYDLSGVPLALVVGIILFVVFCVADVAEDALVSYFNPEA